jgi:class 3 adenylate cyclase/tetratricopeptide (TPR) repeat protein
VEEVIAGILRRLQSKGASALELLPGYHNPDQASLWRADPRLHRAFARKLISQGHPTRGFELAREGLSSHPNDQELQYLLALALARGGNLRGARTWLSELLRMPDVDPALRVEALGLEGRLFKDHYERSRDPARKAEFAARSAASYRHAADLPGAGSFPRINAATMMLLAGDTGQAREHAKAVIVRAQEELQQPQHKGDYWILATLGEAHFILGELDEAAAWYRQAVAKAREQGDVGSIASMRRNALLLKEKLEVSDELLRLFYVGSVVACAGHMIDHPNRVSRDRLAPRFPHDPQLVREVGEAIKAALAELNATVGFCSAACGADLLFAEQLLDRNAELHVVIPFAVSDFRSTSVDFDSPGMKVWARRFDAVLERATQVHHATTEPFLGHEVLFDFVTHFTQGLAITRAAERGVMPQALVVIDSATPTSRGGTGFFLDAWTRAGYQARTIDLRALRQQVLHEPDSPTPPPPPIGPAATPALGERQIKAMLFADVKDFSKLREDASPRFFLRFLTEVHGVLRSVKHAPTFSNTWGDGLYLVFDEATHCAEVALRLLESAEQVDWKEFGLMETNPIRIGLHAGPVFNGHDPIIDKVNYYGSHVTRAARIEPVTIPGSAFVSEQFAALLAVEPVHDFVCEYIGIEHLAKQYDRCPLYRLARR